MESMPKLLKELLDDRMSGKITQEQLDEGCHFWAIDNAYDLTYQLLPSEPQEVKEWRLCSFREKERFSDDVKMRMNAMLLGYLVAYKSTERLNKRNLDYLYDMEKTFMKYDAKQRLAHTYELIEALRLHVKP